MSEEAKIFYRLKTRDGIKSEIKETDAIGRFEIATNLRPSHWGVGLDVNDVEQGPYLPEQRRYRLKKQYRAVFCEFEEI